MRDPWGGMISVGRCFIHVTVSPVLMEHVDAVQFVGTRLAALWQVRPLLKYCSWGAGQQGWVNAQPDAITRAITRAAVVQLVIRGEVETPQVANL